jgi:hypothetical protein
MNNSPSDRETSSSGRFIRRCTNFIFPSTTICGLCKSLDYISAPDPEEAEFVIVPILGVPLRFRRSINTDLRAGRTKQC